MRVLVTGGSGFLGWRVQRRLSCDADVVGTYCTDPRGRSSLVRLDVTARDEVTSLLTSYRFDVVVHAAANCNLEHCETHADEVHALNVEGTRNVVEACRVTGTRHIYISTDHVFDGRPTVAYTESDEPRPIQRYGATKLEGERIVSSLEDALILRVPILYGPCSRREKQNFATSTLRKLMAGEQVAADDHQIRYPVLAEDVAELVAGLAPSTVTGVLHYSSDVGVTKYDWARAATDEFGLSRDLIVPRRDEGTARRPQDNRMTSTRLAGLGIAPPRPVGEGLSFLHWSWNPDE